MKTAIMEVIRALEYLGEDTKPSGAEEQQAKAVKVGICRGDLDEQSALRVSRVAGAGPCLSGFSEVQCHMCDKSAEAQ